MFCSRHLLNNSKSGWNENGTYLHPCTMTLTLLYRLKMGIVGKALEKYTYKTANYIICSLGNRLAKHLTLFGVWVCVCIHVVGTSIFWLVGCDCAITPKKWPKIELSTNKIIKNTNTHQTKCSDFCFLWFANWKGEQLVLVGVSLLFRLVFFN